MPVTWPTLFARASQIAFQLLLDRRVGEMGDVGGIDPMLVVGKTPKQQRKPRPDPEGEQQVLGFEALRHLMDDTRSHQTL